jgi:hypothetical protein
MDWYDWVTLAIMAIVTTVQTMRGVRSGGVGLSLFEAAGGVVAAVAATELSSGVSGALRFSESTVMFVLFLAFLALALVVAHWLAALSPLPFQSFDGVLSFFFGLVLALAVAHMFLRIMIGSAEGETAQAIANSPVAREVFQFQTWNELMRLLFRAKSGPGFDPTEG